MNTQPSILEIAKSADGFLMNQPVVFPDPETPIEIRYDELQANESGYKYFKSNA